MRQPIDYVRLLLEFDRTYFEHLRERRGRLSFNTASYYLATWCFDMGFDIDEYSWGNLVKIEKKFSPQMRNAVLWNLFHRNHDHDT